MKDLQEYLTSIKEKKNIKSNLQLAHHINVSAAGIDNIMKGRTTPGDETCIRIAELSGDDPSYVIALAHKSRAAHGTKKYWDRILKAVMAATFLILVTLPYFLNSGRSLYIM